MTNYLLTENLSLAAGWNTITFQVLDNTMWGDRAGGPCIDCIMIDNYGSATLSWRPYTYNLDRFFE